jgi:hypothetical protein
MKTMMENGKERMAIARLAANAGSSGGQTKIYLNESLPSLSDNTSN